MDDRSTVELYIPSTLGYEQVAMESAASTARLMGFTPDRIEDLKTAVSEACMNAIEHGNKQESGTTVQIALTVEESRLQVDVRDSGNGFSGDIRTPNIEAKLAGRETTRGWGMFLIKNLMDEVAFEAEPGSGSVTRMVIHLQRP